MGIRRHPKLDRKIAEAKTALGGRKAIDPAILFSRVSLDDLSAYSADMLARVAIHAHGQVRAFKGSQALITITRADDLGPEGQPVSIVAITDRNQPFLYDSTVGEVTATLRTLFFAMHPILVAKPGEPVQLFGPGVDCLPEERISHIQFHLPALSGPQADALAERLRLVIDQVHAAVGDWRPMLHKLADAMAALDTAPLPTAARQAERREALAFLAWLRDNNFTFLGMREYVYSAPHGEPKVERARDAGIGILADPDIRVLRLGKDHVTTTPEIIAFLEGPDSLIVTKANMRSLVHRRAYMDYVGVKLFDDSGALTGELRIVGLFTSTAYTRSVMDIPLLRRKVDTVVERLGFDPESHSGKMLFNTLESYPRDDLFQIDTDTLLNFCAQINELGDRPRVRALARIDRFDRFVSIIVFVPRDQYDSDVRQKIGAALADCFDGHVSAYYPSFPEGNLARVHFIVGRAGGKTPRVTQERLEAIIDEIATRWEDRFAMRSPVDAPALTVSEAYRERFSPADAIADLRRIEQCRIQGDIRIELTAKPAGGGSMLLKIFHGAEPVALSRRVPLLENLGFDVISERTFEIGVAPQSGEAFRVILHEMEVRPTVDVEPSPQTIERIEQAFLEVWAGGIDNDPFNRLVLAAGLDVSQAAILRVYGRYMRQLGVAGSQGYIAATLGRYPAIARKLFDYFASRFATDLPADKRETKQGALRKAIEQALGQVANLEEDRILRRFTALIQASLRTNYFQAPSTTGDLRKVLAIKLNPRALDFAPAPKPFREIFVYGAEVEGVHLRFGPVARGGLRWSDRPEDYRTEVLGLVKAQQVKNAVIVPVGSKGGFFPKQLPAGGSRDVIFEAGREAYKTFISTLLSVTDTIEGAAVVHPTDMVCLDGDDPYFVVAADKGTATFSDTANAISQAHGFWLDDAFASGGSAGYDHKKMGITARGAWEAVKRHFREMDIDIQATPFTVAGVGDMSGDVFGNGMLLSKQIRLVAAFDHRDIFIDPDPEPASSFMERQRLFDLPRSSWQDYDKTRLSKGGMIISRQEKSVKLTREAAAAIGLDQMTASPLEIMSAILKAPVDLLWFGGIGTYIRGDDESDAAVGDRANDAIRITASEVRAKVIGEGANLGVTQRGRIGFNLKGGRSNSDAIDNSAGVNSSDVEVNIKIALASAMRDGRLTRPARNRLLTSMTEEVAGLVLRNNYLQSLAVSLAEREGVGAAGELSRLMTRLEEEGRLDRKVELLPDNETFAERYASGRPLTRAELGVLISYAKIALFDDLMASSVPAEPYFDATLHGYFPSRMRKEFAQDIDTHRLRNEIVATLLCNDVINRGGPTFVTRFADASGALPSGIVRAFVIARDGLELAKLYDQIDTLDAKVPGALQNRLYALVGETLAGLTGWALRSVGPSTSIGSAVEEIRKARKVLQPALSSIGTRFMADESGRLSEELEAAHVPQRLARELAMLPSLALIPDIAQIAQHTGGDLRRTAEQYFKVTELFRLGRIEAAASRIDAGDHYTALALSRNLEEIAVARRMIATAALTSASADDDPVDAWIERDRLRVERVRNQVLALAETGEINVARLTVAAGMLADLARERAE